MNVVKLNQIAGLGWVWVSQIGTHEIGEGFITLHRRACCKLGRCCKMVWRLFLHPFDVSLNRIAPATSCEHSRALPRAFLCGDVASQFLNQLDVHQFCRHLVHTSCFVQ